MTSYSNDGFFNPAYHDSETLEIDRRSSSKNQHINPYTREDPAWRFDGADTHHSPVCQPSSADAGRVALGGWQEESWRRRDSIPMGVISNPGSPSWQHELTHSTSQINPQCDQSPSVRRPSSVSGNMTMRLTGITMNRMNMFPNTDPAFIEDAVRNEMEKEEQDLIKELVTLSRRDRIRTIRELPMCFEEKKHIRSQVLAFKTSKQSHNCTCFADYFENVTLCFRRCGYSIRSARQTLELWHGIMKEISGKFGTSVLSYFVFLKWLLMFNIFSFLVNFGFITIPLLVYDPSPNIPPNVSFRGLEILTGAGYISYTVMYYGGYSNETFVGLAKYDMQLAYFFTIAIYMVLCGIALIFSMARSFMKNFVLVNPASDKAWQLLCSWDFSITNERAVRQRKNNLRVQLKESLSEQAQRELLTLSEKLKQFGVYLGSWLLSTSLAVGCGASIYYLCQYEQEQATDAANWTLLQEAQTLLVPFVVSLMNLVVPLFYSLFNKFEHYSSQRRQIYALVVRNIFLKLFILGVLCYYWMNVVAYRFTCWESMVGQALYRLVIVDFLFLMLGSFFGEFLSNLIGTRLLPHVGIPEFDVARNVLELIYAQTLAWIGIYFSPLLPAIQILKFFILFYLKKVSLTHNCQPPRRIGRAAQMQTIFIAVLFFPFFVGALSMVAYVSWRLTPSEQCGPFRGLNSTFSVVGVWMHNLHEIPGSQWVIWIYEHIIESELFYFLIALIVQAITYTFWQISQGRKALIALLRQQIVNVGKDKSFLIDKLQTLQNSDPNKKSKEKDQKMHTKQCSDEQSSGSQSNSNAMVQALLARQQFEEEDERRSADGVPVPADISTPSALMQAMLARQRAEAWDEHLYQMPDNYPSSSSTLVQAMQARQRAESQERAEYIRTAPFSENPVNRFSAVSQTDRSGDLSSSVSSVKMQVREKSAEEEDRFQWVPSPSQNPAPPGSSALIQAMLARQQAQNEFDDGY